MMGARPLSAAEAAASGQPRVAIEAARTSIVSTTAEGATAFHYAARYSATRKSGSTLPIPRPRIGSKTTQQEEQQRLWQESLARDYAELLSVLLEGAGKMIDTNNNSVTTSLRHRTSTTGETAAHWAVRAGNFDALKQLVEADRQLLSIRDFEGFSPFLLAASLVDDTSSVELHQAGTAEHWRHRRTAGVHLLEFLYLQGVCVEEQCKYGRTALQYAAAKGNVKAVVWLLSRGASLAHRDFEGQTVLHFATRFDCNEVLLSGRPV